MRTPNRDDGVDGSVWGQKSFGKESLREPINNIGNETDTVIQNNLNKHAITDQSSLPDCIVMAASILTSIFPG
jgi:hypothetical protein